MVNTPTHITIYIDAAGTEKTRTIKRAELVAIRTALVTFASNELIGIFTDSLSSLQAIRHHNINPSIPSSLHRHHHILLIGSIMDLLETMRLAAFHTTLHEIRAYTNIRRNDLAEAAAELGVRNFDTLPPAHILRVYIGKIAPRPIHWVVYTTTPPRPEPALATGTNRATLNRPWWAIPEAEHLQMHASMRPSEQLRLKVRYALLRSLHHTSLYPRLIIVNKENGARIKTLG